MNSLSQPSAPKSLYRLAILEDDYLMRETLVELLETYYPFQFQIDICETLAEFVVTAALEGFDFVISDLTVSDARPDHVLRVLSNQLSSHARVLIYSGDAPGVESAIKTYGFPTVNKKDGPGLLLAKLDSLLKC